VWKGRAGSDMPRLFFHAFLPRVLIRRLKVSGRKDEFFHSLDGWIEIDDTVSIFPPAPTAHSQRMWTVPEDRFQIAIVIGRLPKLELPSMRTEHGGSFGVTPLTPHHPLAHHVYIFSTLCHGSLTIPLMVMCSSRRSSEFAPGSALCGC
jgi:hypothetical protein